MDSFDNNASGKNSPHIGCTSHIDCIPLYQRLVNMYHFRLLSAYRCAFPSESIPPGREHAPCIADWSWDAIGQVVANYLHHTKAFLRVGPEGALQNEELFMVLNPTLQNEEIFMALNAMRYFRYGQQRSSRTYMENCLDALESHGLHQRTAEMRWVWLEYRDRPLREKIPFFSVVSYKRRV
ncbi:hypothetical protein EDC01DRAFT_763666 [Geopyxis carbonaria]|nr:hypothetical protein EDC01DRAFT_763666 [Geopyxis carbonaria]